MHVDPATPTTSDPEKGREEEGWNEDMDLSPVPVWWSSVSRSGDDNRHADDCVDQPGRFTGARVSDPSRPDGPGVEPVSFLEGDPDA